MIRYFLIAILVTFTATLHSQCPGAVNAGQDRYICFPGGTVNVVGTATPGYTGILWTPSSGVSNPTILNPAITVNGAGPHTFTLTGKYRLPGNLVVNGNFSAGNTGFTSDYINSADLTPEGLYAIVTNPNSVHPGFAACGDHTTGTGNMMVVNGAGTPNLNVWCQTIVTIPNTEYQFETWVTSVANGSPALLQFSINGGTIGPIFQAPSTTCNWQRFSATWNSGANTSAVICIVNQNTALGGNDFALDDIAFHAICTVTDEMTIFVREKAESTLDTAICSGNSLQLGNFTFTSPINQEIKLVGAAAGGCDSFVQLNLEVIELEVDVQQPDILTCYNIAIGVPLYGEVLNYPSNTILYKWINSSGQIISNTNSAQVFSPGQYTLKVTYTGHAPPCAAQNVTVFVDIDTVAPVAWVGSDLKLGCAGGNLVIDGSQSTNDPNISFLWSTIGGHFVSGQNTLSPTVDSAGTYILYFEDPINGCQDADTVVVLPNTGLPTVLINTPLTLSCARDSLILDAGGSDQGSIYLYDWSTPTGNIISGDSTLHLVIDAPGTYTLTIIDTTGPCTNQGNIVVSIDTMQPIAEAGLPDTLDCLTFQLNLSGINSSIGAGYLYGWTGPGILGNPDSILVQINQPGTYYLAVTNATNGCSQLDSVLIIQNAVPPSSDAGPDSVLTCTLTDLLLVGSNTSLGNQISYHWSTINGGIAGNPDTLAIDINTPGTYILIVTDQSNDCQVSDTVEITENIALPLSEAGSSQTLTCGSVSLDLDGTGSSSGLQFDYSWSNADGGVISGMSTLFPSVNLSGWYYLTVLDKVNGCSSVDSVEVLKDNNVPSAVIALPDTLDCISSVIQIDANGSTIGPNITYQWIASNGGNILSGGDGLMPIVDAAGTYILTVKDESNNCTEMRTIQVTQDTIIPKVSVLPPMAINCKNPSVLLDASASDSGPNIQYVWKDPSGNVLPGSGNQMFVGQIGNYTLVLTDLENGCQNSLDIIVLTNVNGPTFQTLLSPDTINCTQSSVIIQAAAAGTNLIYSLANIAGAIQPPNNPNSWNIGVAGQYIGIVTDTLTGCRDTLDVLVLIDTLTPALSPAILNELDCKTNLAAIEAIANPNPAYQYLWSTVDGNILGNVKLNQIQVDKGGEYHITVTNPKNGCGNAWDISLDDPAKPIGEITVQQPLCVNDQGSLTFINISSGLPPYEFSIDGGLNYSSSPNFGALAAGSYQAIIRDLAFCTQEIAINIDNPLPITISTDTSITILKGAQQNLHVLTNLAPKDIQEIIWTPADGLSCSNCLDPILFGNEDVLYTVTIIDINGCSRSIEVRVKVKVNPSVYVPNGFSPDGDGNNDYFNLFGNTEVQIVNSLVIFNRWGAQLAEYVDLPLNDPNIGWDGQFKGKAVQSGIYVYSAIVTFKSGEQQQISGDILVFKQDH